MATIYTGLNQAIEPLVARVYADGVDIHSGRLTGTSPNQVFEEPHPLRACMSFQWQFNDRINGWVDLMNQTTDTHIVDVSSVANSGDYRCQISVGEGADCQFTTEVRTVSIIDCTGTVSGTFPAAGGNQNVQISFPHYELGNQIITTPSWITYQDITCATAAANVCTDFIELTASSGSARNGYVDVQFGSFFCSFTVQQVYAPSTSVPVPTPEEEDPPLGPTLGILNVNGTVLQNSVTTVSGIAYIETPTGQSTDPSNSFTWTVNQDGVPVVDMDGGLVSPAGQDHFTVFVDTSTVGTKIISFTVEINGVSVTETTSVVVTADASMAENGVVSGETNGTGQARFYRGIGPAPTMALDSTYARISNSFSVDAGTATLSIDFNARNSLNQRFPFTGTATVSITLEGPSVIGGRRTITRDITNPPSPPDSSDYLAFLSFNPGRVTASNTDFTDRTVNGGRLSLGNYTITMEITSAGTVPSSRSLNAVYNPNFSYQVFPFFNFLAAS